MSNIVWFILLALFGIILFIFTMAKTTFPRRKLLMIFFVISGMAYVLEYVIFILFHSYDYYPGILKDHWYDSTLGSIVSQALIVPTFTMVIVGFHLRFYWLIGFSGLLMGIETIFLWLEIYEQYWWKTWYTGFFMLICFGIGKFWWKKLPQRKRWMEWFTIYFIINLVNHSISFLLSVLAEDPVYSPGWFSDGTRDSIAMDGLFYFTNSILITFLIQSRFKWYSLILLYIIDWSIFKIFELNVLLQFGPNWNVSLFSILPVVYALITRWLYRYLSKGT